jgi:hypothetical protein
MRSALSRLRPASSRVLIIIWLLKCPLIYLPLINLLQLFRQCTRLMIKMPRERKLGYLLILCDLTPKQIAFFDTLVRKIPSCIFFLNYEKIYRRALHRYNKTMKIATYRSPVYSILDLSHFLDGSVSLRHRQAPAHYVTDIKNHQH